MAIVSARYLDLARQSKRELAAVFAAGSPPDVSALTGFEFRGYNQPRAAALLGIRKFIKAFFVVAGTTLAHSYFLIERYRPLAAAPDLANR